MTEATDSMLIGMLVLIIGAVVFVIVSISRMFLTGKNRDDKKVLPKK